MNAASGYAEQFLALVQRGAWLELADLYERAAELHAVQGCSDHMSKHVPQIITQLTAGYFSKVYTEKLHDMCESFNVDREATVREILEVFLSVVERGSVGQLSKLNLLASFCTIVDSKFPDSSPAALGRAAKALSTVLL